MIITLLKISNKNKILKESRRKNLQYIQKNKVQYIRGYLKYNENQKTIEQHI